MSDDGQRHIGGQIGGTNGKQVVVPGIGDRGPIVDLDKIRDRFEQAGRRIADLLAKAEERKQALENLTTKVDHIVVLMMENRSFDRMLGYLSLEGGRDDVDGLRPGMSNSHDGQVYQPFHLTDTVFEEDPDHRTDAIQAQVANNNSGFVSDFAGQYPGVNPGKIMGYHNASDLAAYDFLAREFTVCHR
jgi:phospholipase C